jgi:hypothetical protein
MSFKYASENDFKILGAGCQIHLASASVVLLSQPACSLKVTQVTVGMGQKGLHWQTASE